MAKKTAPMVVMPFRMPPDLVRRLDAVAKRMQVANPGMTVTRADVVRMLLVRGLEAEEGRKEKL